MVTGISEFDVMSEIIHRFFVSRVFICVLRAVLALFNGHFVSYILS
jgi:hypothetical protein